MVAYAPALSATPAVRQPDKTEDEAADAHLQPRGVVVRRKPVIGKRKHNRHQTENCRSNGDNSQSVDVGGWHRGLHQEVVVLGRLLHINHSNLGVEIDAGSHASTRRRNSEDDRWDDGSLRVSYPVP